MAGTLSNLVPLADHLAQSSTIATPRTPSSAPLAPARLGSRHGRFAGSREATQIRLAAQLLSPFDSLDIPVSTLATGPITIEQFFGHKIPAHQLPGDHAIGGRYVLDASTPSHVRSAFAGRHTRSAGFATGVGGGPGSGVYGDFLGGPHSNNHKGAHIGGINSDPDPHFVDSRRPMPNDGFASPSITVIDSDNRWRSTDDAAVRMAALMRTVPEFGNCYLHYDGLMRGNVGAELATVSAERPVLFCPAVPAIGHTVVNGVLLVNGIPLNQVDNNGRGAGTHASHRAVGAWRAEATIAKQLGEATSTSVSLSQVRSGTLESTLGPLANSGVVVCCDAETAEDLLRIADAAITLGFVMAGASGLAEAIEALRLGAAVSAATGPGHLVPAGSAPESAAPVPVAGVGSHGTLILAAANPSPLSVSSGGALASVPLTRLTLLDREFPQLSGVGDDLVVVDWPISIDLPVAAALDFMRLPVNAAEQLAMLARHSHAGRHIIVVGAQIARVVLDALRISSLAPLTRTAGGTVISVAAGGRLVAIVPEVAEAGFEYSTVSAVLTEIRALQGTTAETITESTTESTTGTTPSTAEINAPI
ncbi:MAG: hypothetical protein JWQ43_3699 [Glaciihabitans sp.]|nr:hypothetical protein [Glaciihabitans sp.]